MLTNGVRATVVSTIRELRTTVCATQQSLSCGAAVYPVCCHLPYSGGHLLSRRRKKTVKQSAIRNNPVTLNPPAVMTIAVDRSCLDAIMMKRLSAVATLVGYRCQAEKRPVMMPSGDIRPAAGARRTAGVSSVTFFIRLQRMP